MARHLRIVLTMILAGTAGLRAAETATVSAEWPRWQGPSFNGAGNAVGLPDKWERHGGNIRWEAAMPGASAATPVVLNGRVYVSAFEKDSSRLLALCVSAKDGKELWRRDTGSGKRGGRHDSAAAASAVAEPGRAIFTFANGTVTAFDEGGKNLWSVNLAQTYGDLGCPFGYSSSPALHEGKLFVQILRDNANPSLLVCIESATGRELWKAVRPTTAEGENKDSYSTPCLARNAGGSALVVVAGGDCITAHDPADGREVWRSEYYQPPHKPRMNRLISSPAVAGDRVVVPVNRGKLLVAARVGSPGWAWQLPGASSDISSPLYYLGKIYVVDSNMMKMFCVDPADGKLLNTVKLPGTEPYYASPTGGDGKIYVMTLGGEVTIVRADQGMEVISHIEMGEASAGSSIAVSGDSIFIRTNTRLVCVGK